MYGAVANFPMRTLAMKQCREADSQRQYGKSSNESRGIYGHMAKLGDKRGRRVVSLVFVEGLLSVPAREQLKL